MKEIVKEISKGQQDVHYVEIIELQSWKIKLSNDKEGIHSAMFPHKLKIDIRSDSYDFQSHAIIWKWSGNEWKVLHSIHFNAMKTPHKLYYKPDKPNDEHFKEDRDKLLEIAKQILQ